MVDDRLSDLKTQNTPFFTAKRYNLDPRTTVTFNEKDYLRYKRFYPQIDIYFWVDWQQTSWKNESVNYLAGIYRLPFAEVAKLIEGRAPRHEYIHRRFDTGGNAKASFVLPLSAFETLMQKS